MIYTVEKIGDLYLKRYDLCKLNEDDILCGGKIEQTRNIIRRNMNYIIGDCHSTVVCQSSVHSTSGVMLSYISSLYNLKCVVVVGGTNENVMYKKNHMLRLCKYHGAEVRNVCGTGMSGPVMHRLKTLCKEKKYFNACFENNVEYAMDPIADQVQNLPDDLDVLVVPTGSGMTLAGILRGLSIYEKKVKRIIGCHVGPDRRNKIDAWYSPLEYGTIDYEMAPLNTVYAKPAKVILENGYQLDGTYEAKAYEWIQDNIDIKNLKTLLWNVGCCPDAETVDNFIEKNS